MARRRTRVQRPERRLVGDELAGVGVEPINHDLIDAFVGDQNASAKRVKVHPMGVRTALRRARP